LFINVAYLYLHCTSLQIVSVSRRFATNEAFIFLYTYPYSLRFLVTCFINSISISKKNIKSSLRFHEKSPQNNPQAYIIIALVFLFLVFSFCIPPCLFASLPYTYPFALHLLAVLLTPTSCLLTPCIPPCLFAYCLLAFSYPFALYVLAVLLTPTSCLLTPCIPPCLLPRCLCAFSYPLANKTVTLTSSNSLGLCTINQCPKLSFASFSTVTLMSVLLSRLCITVGKISGVSVKP